MARWKGFIDLPFQEKGLLFYAQGFIDLPFQEKGLLFYAQGFIDLPFQEKGLLFYRYRKRSFNSPAMDLLFNLSAIEYHSLKKGQMQTRFDNTARLFRSPGSARTGKKDAKKVQHPAGKYTRLMGKGTSVLAENVLNYSDNVRPVPYRKKRNRL